MSLPCACVTAVSVHFCPTLTCRYGSYVLPMAGSSAPSTVPGPRQVASKHGMEVLKDCGSQGPH